MAPPPLLFTNMLAKDPTLCGLLEKMVTEEGGRGGGGFVVVPPAPVSRSHLAWTGRHPRGRCRGEWSRTVLAGNFPLVLYIPSVQSRVLPSRGPAEPWGSTSYSLRADRVVIGTH